MDMHRWSASITTATPFGFRISFRLLAICEVRRSCTCRRRPKASTIRGNLAETDDFTVWYIRHVAFAEKREHVVLAQTENVDVLYDYHLVGVGVFKQGVVDQLLDVDPIPSGQEFHRLGDPLRRILQALAGRVLAQFNQ